MKNYVDTKINEERIELSHDMEDEISIFQQEHSEIQSLPLTDFRHIF